MPRHVRPLTNKTIRMTVSIRLPVDVIKQLDRLAARDQRTRTGTVELAVRRYLAEVARAA